MSPSPGCRGGLIIIKQHLHGDFVYRALSQGWEALGWPVASWRGGRGLWLVPPPSRAPSSRLCAREQSAIHPTVSDSSGFRSFFPSPMKSSLRACHSGQKRGVSCPRGRGWLGPDWREAPLPRGAPHPHPLASKLLGMGAASLRSVGGTLPKADLWLCVRGERVSTGVVMSARMLCVCLRAPHRDEQCGEGLG